MSTTTTQKTVMVYTEATPNPETLKFVANYMLLPQEMADFSSVQDADESPLAQALFEKAFVKGVFVSNNFVTITKDPESMWAEVIPELRQFIKEYIAQDKEVVTQAFLDAKKAEREAAGEDTDIDGRIKAMLDKYVRPAVEMDGGAIVFKSFNEGVVTLEMQGACSGCPSSSVTLKSGIEGMLKRMVPEVTEVVAESM